MILLKLKSNMLSMIYHCKIKYPFLIIFVLEVSFSITKNLGTSNLSMKILLGSSKLESINYNISEHNSINDDLALFKFIPKNIYNRGWLDLENQLHFLLWSTMVLHYIQWSTGKKIIMKIFNSYLKILHIPGQIHSEAVFF